MKYKVLTRCFHRKKVYEVGDVVELEGGYTPPAHFQLLSEYQIPEKMKNADPMAPKAMSFGQPVKMSAGFAAKLEVPVPQPMETAKKSGRPKKT